MHRKALFALAGLMLLVVPPLAAAAAQTTIYAAFQAFESGYMIWRSDTGEIWVLRLFNPYADWGVVHRYPQSAYENLPDNPDPDTPPPGLVRPVSGFGRVWGNFPDARQLGWALAPEQGYSPIFGATTYTAGGLEQISVNFPDGRQIVVREDDTWQFDGRARPIQSLPSPSVIPAAVQAFEGGYMMYWSETGSIWVLSHSGQATLFDSPKYGALPDNPVTTPPPEGRFKPILGFGKVWGNFSDVRAQLGWALEAERGFDMRFERVSYSSSGPALILSSPYGSIRIFGDTRWAFSG